MGAGGCHLFGLPTSSRVFKRFTEQGAYRACLDTHTTTFTVHEVMLCRRDKGPCCTFHKIESVDTNLFITNPNATTAQDASIVVKENNLVEHFFWVCLGDGLVRTLMNLLVEHFVLQFTCSSLIAVRTVQGMVL